MHIPRYALMLAGLPVVVVTIAATPGVADPLPPERPAAEASRTCVDVDIAGERTPDYVCLTSTLRRTVEATKPIANVPPIGLQPSPNQVGLITPTEVRQQYGPNFGKSVVPYRPQRNYPIPLVNGSR